MVLWSTKAPLPRDYDQNYPTLLYTWWCTGFSAFIILARVFGRKLRSNVLFREDWIMLLALLPLLIRMGLIHVVLIWGTNNVQTVGQTFTEAELQHRSIGARLVLGSRIFYALFIWMNKLTVSEFLKRITIRIWRRSYEMTLQGIRIFLVITFFVVIIATLTECQPFNHYWQVVPDPGYTCRQGYGNLISMGTCDIITDILLVAFPIPIVLRSGQTWPRKLQLASLFSLSVIMIAVTATRMPEVIWHLGRQQYRTVWASSEIMASTIVSNAVILGSFVRDKGTKKNTYKPRSQSVSDSIERVSTRRPTMTALQQCGSDEDLFRFLGCRVPEHLQEEVESLPRLAPVALPAQGMQQVRNKRRLPDLAPLQISKSLVDGNNSDDSLRKTPDIERPPQSPASTKRSVSFFDVGGLLENGRPSMDSRSRSTTVVDSGASGTVVQDFAPLTPQQSRRGSYSFISDIGGILPPSAGGRNANGTAFARRQSDAQSSLTRARTVPMGVLVPMLERRDSDQSLQDAGGLLGGTRNAGVATPQPLSPPSGVPSPGSGVTRQETECDSRDTAASPSVAEPPHSSTVTARPEDRQQTQESSKPRSSPITASRRMAADDMQIQDPGGLLE